MKKSRAFKSLNLAGHHMHMCSFLAEQDLRETPYLKGQAQQYD